MGASADTRWSGSLIPRCDSSAARRRTEAIERRSVRSNLEDLPAFKVAQILLPSELAHRAFLRHRLGLLLLAEDSNVPYS